MRGAAGRLQQAAATGAAAKQVDLDVQAYQKARNNFVNAVKVSTRGSLMRGLAKRAVLRWSSHVPAVLVHLVCTPVGAFTLLSWTFPHAPSTQDPSMLRTLRSHRMPSRLA